VIVAMMASQDPAGTSSQIKILGVCADNPNLVRVSVAGQEIKYLLVTNVFPAGWQDKNSGIAIKIPPLPLGAYWNYAELTPLAINGTVTVTIQKKENKDLDGIDIANIPGITAATPTFDYPSFTNVKPIPKLGKENEYTDRLNVVSHPSISGLALMKIAQFPTALEPGQRSQRMRNEITMSLRAAAAEVGPKFLGLVTESSRGVIGFLSEFIQDSTSLDKKRPSKKDFQASKTLLKKMHEEAGMAHCDLLKGNILYISGGKQYLFIDFEAAKDLRGESDAQQAKLQRYDEQSLDEEYSQFIDDY
jgi:hypothetical protein